MTELDLWPLCGILLLAVGLLLKFHPLLVVILSALATALATGWPLLQWLEQLGDTFLRTRNLPLILLLPLAVIGLLERHGLRLQAQRLIGQIKVATTGRLLLVYLALRESSAAAGLTSLGGHPQMVRPLVAPMAEAAHPDGAKHPVVRAKIRAMAAATDNVGLFFGEDIFVAFGAIILMHTFFRESGIETDPLHIALWGIPTAVAAFLIHGYRLVRFDRYLARLQQEQSHD